MGRMKAEAKGRAARKAAASSKAAAKGAVGLKASELLERVREADVAGRVRDAHLDERAAELAERARERVRDAHLDERAAQLAERVRESEAAQRAAAAAKRASDQAFERAGEWITTSGAGERLGIVPQRRRRGRGLLLVLLGVGLGYLAAWLLNKRAESSDDAFGDSGDWMAPTPPRSDSVVTPPSGPAPSATPSMTPDADSALATPEGDAEMPVVSGPLADESSVTGTPLEADVRSSLHDDPRTADLENLAINVAEGTVFIRGSVPSGFDRDTIRDVVAGVPGVTDVDLQVTPA